MSAPDLSPLESESVDLLRTLDRRARAATHALDNHRFRLAATEIGVVTAVSEGVARIRGLPGVGSEEVVRLGRDVVGLALDLRENHVGVALLGDPDRLAAGDEARRTHSVLKVPVGSALLGRVVDAMGRPLDGKGEILAEAHRPVEAPAPEIMDRAPVTDPLETGLIVVDALIPIGRGQRQLIIGDRQTGKTAVALDAIVNQRDQGVIGIYCAIGQRASSIVRVVNDLRTHGALANTVVVASTEEDQPGLRFVAPYAAMAVAEHFMHQGRDALVVFDDMTRHARAYRELSLLLRRPPGREAYPGDIFFVHARLLERSTHLREGGSVSALPVIETEAQDISAYLPTNLISITDGQIVLSSERYQKGLLPAIDVGRSVSRVGGKTQFPAYRSVAGALRLSYAQFEELESFSRFASQLDDETEAVLDHGSRVREVLKQSTFAPVPIPEQIAVVLALEDGLLDDLEIDLVPQCVNAIRQHFGRRRSIVDSRIQEGEPLSPDDRDAFLELARRAIEDVVRPRG